MHLRRFELFHTFPFPLPLLPYSIAKANADLKGKAKFLYTLRLNNQSDRRLIGKAGNKRQHTDIGRIERGEIGDGNNLDAAHLIYPNSQRRAMENITMPIVEGEEYK